MNKTTRLVVVLGALSLLFMGSAGAEAVRSTLGAYNQVRAQMNLPPIAGDPNTPLICSIQKDNNGGTKVNCSALQQNQQRTPQYQPQQGYYQDPHSQIIPLPKLGEPSQGSQYQRPSERIIPMPKIDASEGEWNNFERDTRNQKNLQNREQAQQQQRNRREEETNERDHQNQLRRIERFFQ